MNRHEKNKYAVTLVEEMFREHGFKIEQSNQPRVEVNFNAISNNDNRMKIKVKVVTKIGSYVFNEKTKFDITDSELYMAVLYLPDNENEKILYLVPATEWVKDIYPFKGKDYGKLGQTSKPEWGIGFSQKAKDAMESYRFSNVIMRVE